MMMTKEQYIESLRKLNLNLYMFGKKVEDPVDNPVIRPSLNSFAATYELAEDPQYEDLMVATSHLTGKKVNRFTHMHQSTDDLIKKVKMQRLLG
ncbi:4-hydroxybutyryl-CoA dehydratase, partial [Intestinibacillus massiliensis]|nr:4-hydroxybutyryl-CoA dehydratase [Intestinibacillus massiliensis]